MASIIARLLLTLTSIAPVLVVWCIADISRYGWSERHAYVLSVGALLALVCLLVMLGLARQLPKISLKVMTIKATDTEVVAFIVTYLLPLAGPSQDLSTWALALIGVFLLIALSTSNAFTFNPIMAAFGYHFYEIGIESGTTFLLISRRNLIAKGDINSVGRVSPYILIDTK